MKELSPFASKVLNAILPQQEDREKWIGKRELFPVSKKEEFVLFKERIAKALDQKEKILVAGDFDCDGIMATSILCDGLKKLGLEVGWYIPDRIREGYGLSASTVELAFEKGYSLIITVDNGVRAFEALEKAKELGMEVIVTDHHAYEEKPLCSLFIHPDLLEEEFSSLCGAALAFELCRFLGTAEQKHLRWAAVATIGDCMQVTGQSRAIIQQGLDSLAKQGDAHLSALLDGPVFNETDVSFQIVPKINSIGRMSDMARVNSAVHFMLSDNPIGIRHYQEQIERINRERKELSARQSLKAASQISLLDPILIAADSCYHEGIIGIIAGQLCASYDKPAIVASLRDGICKASMRSPKGFNCLEFLEGFAKFESFGGHREAAGFSILEQDWPEFEAYCLETMKKISWHRQTPVSLEIDPDEISLFNIDSLDVLRPFGPGFELPAFVIKDPKIASTFDLSNGKHRKFMLSNGICAINFNQSSGDMARRPNTISHLTGTMQPNTYRGRRSANFIISRIDYY